MPLPETSTTTLVTPQQFRGITLHAASFQDSLSTIISAAQSRKPFTVEYVAVNNLITGVLNVEFKYTLSSFDLLLADGRPIHWALKYLFRLAHSEHTPARVQMLSICAAAEKMNMSIYLYGSTPLILKQLSAQLRQSYSRLNIVQQKASLFRKLQQHEIDALIEDFNKSKASFIFVALGCPLQEQFVAALGKQVNAVCLCVGSAFEIHAGIKKSPSRWVSKIGMEWFFRLSHDPRRLWKRYFLTNSIFLLIVVRRFIRIIYYKITKK